MGYITNFAVKTLMKRTHPTVNRKECWNTRPHKEKCSACMDICPYGEDIFKRPNMIKSWDKCTDCGLCVSVCKTRCIAPSRQVVDADTSPVELPDDFVWIGCVKSKRENNLVRECIGALSWETLAYLALGKKVVLDATPCATCENEVCAAQFRAVLERTVEFLGPDKFNARIALAYEENELPFSRQEFSRRDLMGKMTDGSKVNSKKLLRKMPFLQNAEDAHQFDFRLMLHERIKYLRAQTETPATYGFKLPVINDKCYGCERCVKACKTGAMQLIRNEGDTQGKIVITAWKCSECEQCRFSCSEKAIDMFALRQVTSLGPIAVKTMEINLCPSCGKAKKPNPNREMCVTCDIRERSKKRAEESKARVEERKRLKAEQKAAEEAEAAKTALEAGEVAETVEATVEAATDAVESAAEVVVETAKEAGATS